MLSISAKADYGLTTVLELALRTSEDPIQIRDLAERHAIPQHYLEQLLVTLKRRGIVKSFRGARGGYALAKNPSDIRVLDVFEALDGDIHLLPEKRQNSPIAFFTRDVEARLIKILGITIEELVLKKQDDDRQFIYTI
jgi:Rrf2 family transcriptional regulator, cysteine metabolism repressor